MELLKQLFPGLRMTLVMTVLTGLLYPGLITGICQAIFPGKANGSLIQVNDRVIGSALIGQEFTKAGYFHSRPSAVNYDASASGGSNFGPTNQKLIDRVKASVDGFRKENPDARRSGAGLLVVNGHKTVRRHSARS